MFGESFREAWQLRFGREPGFEIPEVAPFLTHRSVRDYSDQPVSPELLASLIGAAQSAATSSNLQLWSVISVKDPERRARIATLCGEQKQIVQAPVFLAFLADHYRMKHAAAKIGEPCEGFNFAEFYTMAIVDAALAAERLVCAAESAGLGICYIGGLRNNAEGIKQELNLPKGVFGVFGLCIGYPTADSTAEVKPRLKPEAVWFEETYNPEPDTDEYNQRARAFYEAQHMKGDVTWTMRSSRRIDRKHMSGRDVLKGWLESQGFNLE